MSRVAAWCLVVGLAAGCDTAHQADVYDLSQDPATLVGSWEWERDSYYWTGQRESDTPRSTGETEALVFTPDGSLTILRNGVVEVETTYRVESEAGGGLPILDAGAFGRYVFGTRGRTLVMHHDRAADGPERVFRRRD